MTVFDIAIKALRDTSAEATTGLARETLDDDVIPRLEDIARYLDGIYTRTHAKMRPEAPTKAR